MELCNKNDEQDGYTPLMGAVKHGHVKIVQLLVPLIKNLGKNEINSRNHRYETALHVALMQRFDAHEAYQMAKYLIDNGIDVNAGNIYDENALFMACAYSHINIDICKLLIEHPRIIDNIDTCGCYKELALFALIDRFLRYPLGMQMSEFKQFFQFIIDHGIKTQNDQLKNIAQIRDRSGQTLLMFVAKSAFVKCFN